MSGAQSGHNAPKDARTTQREAREVFGRSDIEESDVKQGDLGQCAIKSAKARDVRRYSGKNYSSSSRKQQGKSGNRLSVGRGTSESRVAATSKGKIWEPDVNRGSRLPSRQQSCGSLRMAGIASEADVTPSYGGVQRADTHTGGVLHVGLAMRQPMRAISEGGAGRRVVEKREEDDEGEAHRRLSELEERLSGILARWNGKAASFGRMQDTW